MLFEHTDNSKSCTVGGSIEQQLLGVELLYLATIGEGEALVVAERKCDF